MKNEEFYARFTTECCKASVEIKVDDRFLLEERYEATCPLCNGTTKVQ